MKEHQKILTCEMQVKKAFKYRYLFLATTFFTALYALCGAIDHWGLEKRFDITLIIVTYLFTHLLVYHRLKSFHSSHVFKSIEKQFPELEQRAFTALDLLKKKPYEQMNKFEKRVVDEVVDHEHKYHWIRNQFQYPIAKYRVCHLGAILLLIAVVIAQKPMIHIEMTSLQAPGIAELTTSDNITIHPGHTEVERLQNLLVTAEFPTQLDHQVELVHIQGNQKKSYPMQRNLDDPIYATSIQQIEGNSQYQVFWKKNHRAFHSETFSIEVFEFPRLEQLEVIIASPEHYGIAPRTLMDPEKVKAYKGSKITLRARFNLKELQAEMIMGDQNLAFKAGSEKDFHQELSFSLEKTTQAEFILKDKKGRKNPLPHRLNFELLKNKQPRIEVILPKRDIELTSISELPLKAKIKDDVALLDWGLELYINGYDPIIISHQNQSTNKSPVIDTYVPLELYDLREKDVLSYHFYAVDQSLDKKERKVFSDLYYVQIRPFLRSYVKNNPMPGQPSGDILKDFVNQQKDIVAALFKLKKLHHDQTPETKLIEARDLISASQAEIAEQLQKKINEMPPDNPALIEKLSGIQMAMVAASEHQSKIEIPAHDDQLQVLLSEAQAILSELFKLRSAMVRISQQSNSSSNNNSQQAKMQKKKKLKLAANPKYKEEQENSQEESALSEELLTLHALQELAQRQMDLNREMESLLAQLEKAKEKEELLRKLKKLREEQQQIQKEAQAMQQQMQNSNNSDMQQQQQNLEKSSQAMAQASKNLSQQNFDEALANSQKAQRELQNAEQQMRETSSQKLGEKMNQLSQQAKELSQQLEHEQQATAELQQQSPQLSNAEKRQNRADSIEQRKRELENLFDSVESMTRSSDNTQKALSDELYRALRQAKIDRIEKNLQDASELTQHGIYSQAMQNLEEGKGKLDNLSSAIDRAADLILGDESKSLAQAQKSLSEFSNLIEQEMQRLNKSSGSEQQQTRPTSDPKQDSNQGQAPSPSQTSQAQQPNASGQQEKGSQPSDPSQQPARQQQASLGQQGKASQPIKTPGQEGKGSQPSESSQPATQQQVVSGRQGRSSQPSNTPGQTPSGQQSGTQTSGQQQAQQANNSHGTGNSSGLFNQPGEIMDWLLKLRNVEQLVRNSDQRQNLSGIRDRLRELYHEQKRHSKPPQAQTVQQKIHQPLVELLKQMDATQLELLREKEQIQIDRDSIPDEFKKMVQEYFLNLSESE